MSPPQKGRQGNVPFDFLILAAYIPLGATIAHERNLRGDLERIGKIQYRPKFSDQPVACAAGVPSLNYMDENDLVNRAPEMASYDHLMVCPPLTLSEPKADRIVDTFQEVFKEVQEKLLGNFDFSYVTGLKPAISKACDPLALLKNRWEDIA